MSPNDIKNCETITNLYTHNWWLLALRGVAAMLFGVMAFVWPGITMATLILFFGAYAVVNGVLTLILAAKAPKGLPKFRSLILPGLISVAAGIVAFIMPGITALVFLVLIASWAIVTGIMEVAAAIRLRKVITHEWLLILAGVASVVFGVMLMVWPFAGALAVLWWIGSFAIVFGVMLLAQAFRLRKWSHTILTATSAPAAA